MKRLSTTPQQALNDFQENTYLKENYEFLIPVYEKLFEGMGAEIIITEPFKEDIKKLKEYFSYVKEVEANIGINEELSKKEAIDEITNNLDINKITEASVSLGKIVDFIYAHRSNINGLEIFSWTLLNKTSLEEIRNFYILDEEKEKNLESAITSFELLSLILEYPEFYNIMLDDLMMPVELKAPTRRQGLFDKEVFRLISKKIKEDIEAFKFEDEINSDEVFLKNETNWLITEKTTKKIKFPLPHQNSKKIDMLSKIGKSLFIGTHKEQKSDGGAQDNQAVDAGFLFDYTKEELATIGEMYNVDNIYLCIFLERGRKKITSSHWDKIFEIIKNENNIDKYILSSYQFVNLVKDNI